MSDANKAGFHVGSVGGNFSVSAGGDVVAGDKVTTSSTTTITNGFQQEEDKQQFTQKLEELRTAFREIQTKIQGAAGGSQDDKDEIVSAVMQQVNALRTAKEEAASLPVAQQASPDQGKRIAGYLQSTESVLDKVNDLGAKAIEIGTAVKPYIQKALPLLLSARMLFGIP
jgi:hypothetical protein